MHLYLIRHTKVNVNPRICYGQSDVGVTKSFSEEAKIIQSKTGNIEFDLIYSSPLFRCRVLAENLFPDRKIVFDKRLKELNFGDWEFMKWDDIYHSPKGKKWMNNYQTLPTLNGESYPEMQTRIALFYSELIKMKKQNIGIVTHAGVIRIFKSIIENQPINKLFETFKPAFGSLTTFEI